MTYKLTNTSQPADPYYGAVSLLLHGDGADGSTQIIDSSPRTKTVTAVGNARISTAQSKFNGASMYFDGSGDYLYVPDSTDWDVSGDYTIEFWAWHPLSGPNYTLGYLATNTISGTSGFVIGHYLGNLVIRTASATLLSTGTPIGSSVWNHIALVWSSSTLKGYVNGTEVLSTTAYTTSTSVPLIIGNFNNLDANRYYNGYIDDLRITKGVARYTSNFTPPTQPFQSLSVRDPQFNAVSLLLKGEGVDGSTTIVDSSPTPKTVTAVGDAQISTAESKFSTSSLYFDGSGDYLSTGPDSNLALGSGDFTVEAFIYVTSLSSNSRIASSRALNVSGDLYWLFNVDSSGRLNFQSRTSSGTQYYAQSNTSAITTNTWYHVAGVRHNNILTVYIDGVAGPTTANDGGNDLSESYVGVGVFNYPGFVSYFPGYIDDFRITKGVARYTSNFTPPGPLPTF